jgi:peptidoglycan hydrolase CwlO-like protein
MFENVKGFISDVKTLNTQREHLQSQLNDLKENLQVTQQTADDIQTSVEKFKFVSKPHQDRIKEAQANIEKELAKYRR